MKPKLLPILLPILATVLLAFAINGCQKEVVEKAPLQSKKASVNNNDGPPGAQKPTVYNVDVFNVIAQSAWAGGIVSLPKGSPAVLDKGLVWSDYYFPTLEEGNYIDYVSAGLGVGTFTAEMPNLEPGKVYYVCAYATNSVGTNYSLWETFAPSAAVTVTDCPEMIEYEGGIYHGVQIGGQCWMKENLNIGTIIPAGTVPTNNLKIEKYCYNNSEANCTEYGALYSWDEMMQYTDPSTSNPSGVTGICPPGWHIPSMAEATQLKVALGGESVAGGAMKETGNRHWKKQNVGATNSSGFTALGSGLLQSTGYLNLQITTRIWTTNDFHYRRPPYPTYYWTMELRNAYSRLDLYHYAPEFGNPVRCLKDPATN